MSRNRELMPWTAGQVDELRKYFPNAQVLWASENGRKYREQKGEGVIASDSWRRKKP